jgi:hypothetical protein
VVLAPCASSGLFCVHWDRSDPPSCPYTIGRHADLFTCNRTCSHPHPPPFSFIALWMRACLFATVPPLPTLPCSLQSENSSLTLPHASLCTTAAPTFSHTRTHPHPSPYPLTAPRSFAWSLPTKQTTMPCSALPACVYLCPLAATTSFFLRVCCTHSRKPFPALSSPAFALCCLAACP